MSVHITLPKTSLGGQCHRRYPNGNTVAVVKQESYKFEVLVPELTNTALKQLTKVSSTRRTRMCLTGPHSLLVRQAGQMSAPFYRQEAAPSFGQ